MEEAICFGVGFEDDLGFHRLGEVVGGDVVGKQAEESGVGALGEDAVPRPLVF